MQSFNFKKTSVALMLSVAFLFGWTAYLYPCQDNIAHASVVETIEGTPFWNGDTRYPFMDMGNRFGNALDLTSAYYFTNNKKESIIVVNSMAISLELNTIEDTAPIRFIEDKATKKITLVFQNKRTKPLTDRMGINAYYYMKDYLRR